MPSNEQDVRLKEGVYRPSHGCSVRGEEVELLVSKLGLALEKWLDLLSLYNLHEHISGVIYIVLVCLNEKTFMQEKSEGGGGREKKIRYL